MSAEFKIAGEALEREVRAFREARVARLTGPAGWLSLVNKTWIGEGAATMGADEACDIVLPAGRAAERVGTFTRAGLVVRFEAAPGVEVTSGGQAVTSVVMRSDAEAEPHRLAVGPFVVELIRRADDFAVRVRDPDSPARREFAGVPCYDVNPTFWIPARLEPDGASISLELIDSDGRPQKARGVGVAVFEIAGTPCRLRLFDEDQGRRLFVLFGDATNRDETYGAGRFLYAPLPTDGRVLLDFNKAFNPPCAFTAFASCPLPPPENRLPVRIEAGEKRPY
jgi:uncharacterized protein (DUF1684 family)